jgi:branched-chain amino acid transport system substrate-binding protein
VRRRTISWRARLVAVGALGLVLAVAAAGATVPRLDDVAATGPGGGNRSDALAIGAAGDATNPSVGDATAADGAGGTRPTSAGAGDTNGASSGQPRASASGVARASRDYPPGVTDTSIRIGGSTFTSGPAAVYGEQIAVGFAAGVRYINDHGGINGRRIDLVLYDDGGDPAKQFTNAKRLVEVDKVFALAMLYAPITGEYVAAQRIPVFHLGQFDEEFTNPWWFPVGGPQRLASMSTAWFGAKKLGVKKAAIFYLDAGAANYSRKYAEQAASDWTAYGVEKPLLVPFGPDQTSCSDAISQARNAGVDFIDFEIDAAHVIKCGVEAQLQAYKPPKGWGGYLIGVPVIPQALGDYSLGMYAFDAFGALYDVPAYKEYVRKVSSSTESYSSVTASYFVSALLMRDAIASLGDDITREGLRDALNGLRNWRPGLTNDPNQPTWTWTPQCHVALHGGYVIQVQKHDGELRWTQITPQFDTTPLPPGTGIPPQYAGCPSVFRQEPR